MLAQVGGLTALRAAAEESVTTADLAFLEQAATLIEETAVHLPVWQARGLEPVASLRRLVAAPPDRRGPFHRDLLAIFAALGDQHTQCYLPEPWASSVAFLPFVVQDFWDGDECRLLVVSSAVDAPRRGDVLLTWDGRPVEHAVADLGVLQFAYRPAARRAKALQTLTFRPLAWLPPPAGDEVELEVESAGRRRRLCLPWQVASARWLREHLTVALGAPTGADGFVRADRVTTPFGTFGHLRVRNLEERPEQFRARFLAALETLPGDGLILDLRGCEKGLIPTGEQLLQLFVSARIEPLRFQFRVTRLIARLASTCAALSDWRDAVATAARCDDVYSEARPLTPPEAANGVGRRYFGPVVLLVDGLTYSTAEMIAAGFQDHGIGPVLGTDESTGGGGGSPWSQNTIFQLSREEALRPSPHAAQMRVAVRRCLRSNGTALESVGITPERLHRPTRADRLDGDAHLITTASRWLATGIH